MFSVRLIGGLEVGPNRCVELFFRLSSTFGMEVERVVQHPTLSWAFVGAPVVQKRVPLRMMCTVETPCIADEPLVRLTSPSDIYAAKCQKKNGADCKTACTNLKNNRTHSMTRKSPSYRY